MRDNWERGLDEARGKYLIVLSDKDMLIPGALSRIALAAQRYDASMLTFRKASFGTEEHFVSCIQRCSGEVNEQLADPILPTFLRTRSICTTHRMLYNSAVRREVILGLRDTGGQFFAGTSPDIGPGVTLYGESS